MPIKITCIESIALKTVCYCMLKVLVVVAVHVASSGWSDARLLTGSPKLGHELAVRGIALNLLMDLCLR